MTTVIIRIKKGNNDNNNSKLPDINSTAGPTIINLINVYDTYYDTNN